MKTYDIKSFSINHGIGNILRKSELTYLEKQYLGEDEQLETKIWRPLRKLYRQHLFHSLLPSSIKQSVFTKSISVLNISTKFYCTKHHPHSLIEIKLGVFGRPCPNCIGESTEVEQSLNINKIKALINILQDQFGLQVVTFVGQGEPLEQSGHREIVCELIKYVHDRGLKSLVYTGGHSLDKEVLSILEQNETDILLSTYGLPFLEPDIFEKDASLKHYSNITHTPEGIPLLFSQRNCARNVKNLFALKRKDDWETNIAISVVLTPLIAGDINSMRHLKNFTTMAKSHSIAVFAWEEYRLGMSADERKDLEEKARAFSSWCELGSLYVWNRCRFGTGGSVSLLANGQITNCPHSTVSTGLGIDNIIDDSGKPISCGIARLQSHAHRFDPMACILRGTKIGQRKAATVPLKQITGNIDIYDFLDKGFTEFPYIYEMWRQQENINNDAIRHLSMKNLKDYLTTDYLWFALLNHSVNGSKHKSHILSPAQRYINDEYRDKPIWQKIVSTQTGHSFHESERSLIANYNLSSKIVGQSVILLGMGDKEDMILSGLSPEDKTLYLIDIRQSVVLEKARLYEKMGFKIEIISCFFEDIGKTAFIDHIRFSKGITVVILGCTIGNFPQDQIWKSLMSLAGCCDLLQIVFSLQLTHSIDREQHISEIYKMYNENTFRSFIFNPFNDQVAKSRFFVQENGGRRSPLTGNMEVIYDSVVDCGLGGIVGRVKFTEACKWENSLSDEISLLAGTELEIYRSLKPDLITYLKYLKNFCGSGVDISVLGIQNDIAIFQLISPNNKIVKDRFKGIYHENESTKPDRQSQS